MATLVFSDDFVGTDGDLLDTAKWDYPDLSADTSSLTILGNEARLFHDNNGQSVSMEALSATSTPLDVETVEVLFPVYADVAGTDYYLYITLHDGALRPYQARLTSTDGDYRLNVAGTEVAQGTATVGISTSTSWVRFQWDGSTLRLKRWAGLVGDEPATWDEEYTDPDAVAGESGSVSLEMTRFVGVDTAFLIDTVEVYDLATSTELATPSGFTFEETSDTAEVSGSWSAVTDAETYDYEVEEYDGTQWQEFALASVSAPTTSFTLTSSDGVKFGTQYRGRVRADSSTVDMSAWTDFVAVTTDVDPSPEFRMVRRAGAWVDITGRHLRRSGAWT